MDLLDNNLNDAINFVKQNSCVTESSSSRIQDASLLLSLASDTSVLSMTNNSMEHENDNHVDELGVNNEEITIIDPLDYLCDTMYNNISGISHDIDIAELSMENIDFNENERIVSYTIDRTPSLVPTINTRDSPTLDYLPESVTIRS